MATRIVIVGGGFGGVYAALELERRLGARPSVEVTIVNRDNFFLFTPMLHEVAASDLDVTHIVNPVRKLLRHARFFDGDVRGIDLEQRTVEVAHGADGHTHALAVRSPGHRARLDHQLLRSSRPRGAGADDEVAGRRARACAIA